MSANHKEQAQCRPVTALVISLPADELAGHETLLSLLEAGQFPELSALILVARAAPLGKKVASDAKSQVAVLAVRYQQVAAQRGLKLMICGQAADHYGLRAPEARGSGVELTGFMELAALLESKAVRSGQERVLVW